LRHHTDEAGYTNRQDTQWIPLAKCGFDDKLNTGNILPKAHDSNMT